MRISLTIAILAIICMPVFADLSDQENADLYAKHNAMRLQAIEKAKQEESEKRRKRLADLHGDIEVAEPAKEVVTTAPAPIPTPTPIPAPSPVITSPKPVYDGTFEVKIYHDVNPDGIISKTDYLVFMQNGEIKKVIERNR